MKIMDILEMKIKETLLQKTILESEQKSLVEEVARLNENIKRLELERDEARERVEKIIEKIELYLTRSEA